MKAKLMLTLGVALVSGLNVFGQDANANKRTEKIEKTYSTDESVWFKLVCGCRRRCSDVLRRQL